MQSKEILNKEKILDQARAFIDEGKFDKAIREYEKILLVDPSDLRVKLRIAELYTKRKQIQDAIRIYREVADSYATEGFYLKSVTVYKNILRLNPSLTEINELLGALYEKMGLTSDAIRQYDILASALDLRGEVERVLELRGHIVRLNPSNGSARIKLAEQYQREGRTPEAIDEYEEYARRIGDSEGSSIKMADLYEKILVHRPDNQEMIRKLIAIYEKMEEHKKALKWLEHGKDFVETDPTLLELHARMCALQNQTDSARGKYMLLADLHKNAGDDDAALNAFCEILVILPDEEDGLGDRVNEVREGALPQIAARAQKKREELEREEIRRQRIEDGEDEAEIEVETKAEPEPQVQPELQPKPRPKAQPEPQPQPTPIVKVSPEDRKRADAAYDLGTMYLKMGLSSEANSEFSKAKGIYEAIADAGDTDDTLKERLSYILSTTKHGARAEKVEVRVETKEAPKPKPQPKPQPKPKPKAKQETKKKKISFV